MTSIQEAQNEARRRLTEARVESAALDARLLLQYAMEWTPEQLLLKRANNITDEQYTAFMALVDRRAAHEPVAKIIGQKEFYGRTFITTRDTLDPRPDSETLVTAALEKTPTDKPCRILDLGTGTGCLIISLLAERPQASGVAVDISSASLDIARENAAKHDVLDRMHFIRGSWFDSLASEPFDLIISNPPYIAPDEEKDLAPEVRLFDPKQALIAENDGLAAYREIVSVAPQFLNPGGWLMVEIGKGQNKKVENFFRESNLSHIKKYDDLSNVCRVVSGQYNNTAQKKEP